MERFRALILPKNEFRQNQKHPSVDQVISAI